MHQLAVALLSGAAALTLAGGRVQAASPAQLNAYGARLLQAGGNPHGFTAWPETDRQGTITTTIMGERKAAFVTLLAPGLANRDRAVAGAYTNTGIPLPLDYMDAPHDPNGRPDGVDGTPLTRRSLERMRRAALPCQAQNLRK